MTDRKNLPISGVIRFDQTACTGCGTCELVCSALHRGIINPKLSCITIYFNPASCEPDHDVCRQCRYPSCLYACPSDAISVDEATGGRYIEYENCVSCGSCHKACPFTPDRAMIKCRVEDGKDNYFKCDLCRGRDEGPMCVRFCPARALVFVTAESRKKGRVQEEETGREEIAATVAKDFFKPESQQEE